MSQGIYIRDRQLTDDPWVSLTDEDIIPASGQIIVSLKRWTEEREALSNGALAVGVHLPNTVNLDDVWSAISDRPLIELEFPGFADGRAYSQARLSRERYQYAGDVRATGAAVVLDQAVELARCGVNAFKLRADQPVQPFIDRLNHVGDRPWYQSPAPTGSVFARRRAG